MADLKGNTVTRAQLSEAVYQEVGLSRNESADLVDSILDEIAQALVQGESVKISSFGSFLVRVKGERVGTSFGGTRRGRGVLVFRASHVLKDRVNKGIGAAA